jgi:phage terminase large subunit-like protein
MTAEPRWSTPRTTSRKTMGDVAGKMAVALGLPLMGWQQRVADVALEQNDDGRFAYRDVALTVPRQQGKSSLLLVIQMTRALASENQNVRYAAQHGAAARQKLIDDWLPALKKSPLSRYFRPRLTSGHEALLFDNGSSIGLVASTEKSGHGSTVDLAVMDEAFAHPDARVEQSLRPAMLTRPNAQLWIVSTAGTMSLLD